MNNALEFYEKINLLKVQNFQDQNLHLRFHELADTLSNKSLLYIANHPFRIAEVEFYGYSPTHQDPYTHKALEQKQFGQWYFHKKGNSYKGGTFKGLDLTLGDGTHHLGVLIRQIEDCDSQKTIDGPSLVVDEILELTSSKNINELMLKLTPETLKVVSSNQLEMRECLTAPRVGLKPKTTEDISYLFAPFRYLTNPQKTKQGKPLLYLWQYHLYGQIEALKKVKNRRVEALKYQNWLHSGQQMTLENALQNYSGKVQALCQLFGAYMAAVTNES